MHTIESLRFLSEQQVRQIAQQHGTPVFVYDQATLQRAASAALAFPSPFGLTVRYAMKANSNAAILRLFDQAGLHIDASSDYEAERAIRAGIAPQRIMLTTQQLPRDLPALLEQGVLFNATSLRQIEEFGRAKPGGDLSIRINPGLGSGSTNRTNVGGPAASFGIWHSDIDAIFSLIKQCDLHVTKLHTHIGSGSDPAVWQKIAVMSLEFVSRFPEVTTLSLGGGYKVGRMNHEAGTDLSKIGIPVQQAVEAFAESTGRKISLEIEPGTFLLANAATLITTIQDMTSTGTDGYTFLKTDTGMTDILRPSIYGAQHPIIVVSKQQSEPAPSETKEYIVVGHCCESGDILTPAPDDPEALQPRPLKKAHIGDLIAIEGAGAYCAAMCAVNYNSFPQAAEVMLLETGQTTLVRKRQTIDQITQNEIIPQ